MTKLRNIILSIGALGIISACSSESIDADLIGIRPGKIPSEVCFNYDTKSRNKLWNGLEQ